MITSQIPATLATASPKPDIKTNDKALSKASTLPGTFQISKDKWDGETNYTISMNMWWGENGDTWRLYENGKLVKEIPLTSNSPNPQTASASFTNKRNATYVYTSELVNSKGITKGQNSITHVVTKNDAPLDIPLPDYASGNPVVGYQVLFEDDKTFEWVVYAANPNKNYVWDGNSFSLWNLEFTTDNEITSVSNAQNFSQVGNKVTINFKQADRLIPLNTTKTFIVRGNKKSDTKPNNFIGNKFRGDISYPSNADLPSTWSKNKTDLNEKDLIANPTEYYNTNIKNNTGNMLMYTTPASDTQLILAEPDKVNYPVNGVDNLKIWIPSKFLAMGLGTTQEFFGLNPNFMVGLSIKENFTCGLAPIESGYSQNIVNVDGKDWSWPIQKLHPDGPFQQEAGNFNEVKKQYSDYLPESADHKSYVTLKTGEPNDPSYVHSAISSGISLTMTREFLYAIPKNNFAGFIENSKDPYAEYVLVDNAYNRGVYGLLQRNLFTEHREAAINSTNLTKDYELGGFASHVETVQNIIWAMDKETQSIYDAEITWTDMENYLKELKLYYGNGVPSDIEWESMNTDVKKAFDILSKHWGGDYISLRYDFLTLLRVCEKYLPDDTTPSPTGASWIDQVNSANQ